MVTWQRLPFRSDELALGQLEDVLPAVDDANAALGRALADVARAEPAVLERALCLFFVSIISVRVRVRWCVRNNCGVRDSRGGRAGERTRER